MSANKLANFKLSKKFCDLINMEGASMGLQEVEKLFANQLDYFVSVRFQWNLLGQTQVLLLQVFHSGM